MSMTMRLALLIAALIGSCSAAKAGASGAYSEVFALDWDGLRSYLLEKGIDFRFGYVSETSTNVQGEIKSCGVTRTNGLSARRSIFKSFSDSTKRSLG